jgi:hypothetical protein
VYVGGSCIVFGQGGLFVVHKVDFRQLLGCKMVVEGVQL